VDDLRRLTIIEEIRALRSRYFRYLDTQQWDEFGALFTIDCVLDFPFDSFTPEPGGRAIAAGVAEVLGGGASVHQGMQHEIEVLDGSHARAIWAMSDLLMPPPGDPASSVAFVRGHGHYVDEYRCVDGRWLFSHVELYRIHREITSHAKSEVPLALRRQAHPEGGES
jgi:hypothetical protein